MAFYHCSIKTSKDKKGNFIPGKKHADYINREGEYKHYDNKSGLAHAEYINREKDFARQEFLRKHGQCVYKANKLPKWAKGNPSEFFKSADVYGRKNKASYREFELALQEELTLEQNIEIVNTILNNYEYFQDKYYAVAIHDKQAALDDNKQQIHCHIMASDKMIDDIEKTNERPPEQFFKTYCRVNTDKGGAKVDRYFSKDNFGKNLTHFRKYYCDITNAIFRKYGIDKTIDHKSLKMQREEALRNGDYVRAEILNRPAEQYIGTIASYDKNNPLVQKLLENRKYITERTNLLLAASETEKNIKDTILIDKINSSMKEANDAIDERCNTLESKVADISILKNDILFLLNQIKETSKDDLKKMLEEARAYNEKLRKAKVVLTDPFSGDATEGISEEEYYHALAVDNTGVMCTLEIPVIGVDLPVYHGTSDEVLEKGIGHLEGTSLPVGGKGTHAVITGHTGINKAKMFTDLTELKKGNQFYIHVLGKVLAYEVDDINVVLPEDTRKLSIVDGKDYVTLITCTPYGENTHRLLVRGKRTKYVPQKRENEKKKKKIGNSQWMRNYRKGIIIGLIVSGIFLLLFKIFQKIRSKKKNRG